MRLILTILLIVLVGLVLILGLGLGLGWLLTLFLPLSLFEGSTLILLVGIILGFVVSIVVKILATPLEDILPAFGDDAFAPDYETIPAENFFKNKAEKTWENFFRYECANEIYQDLQGAERLTGQMGEKQVQALATRLADIGLAHLKTKTVRAKNLNITQTIIKRQMQKMGQQPYDNGILTVAVEAINANIDYYYDELADVIAEKAWSAPADKFV